MSTKLNPQPEPPLFRFILELLREIYYFLLRLFRVG